MQDIILPVNEPCYAAIELSVPTVSGMLDKTGILWYYISVILCVCAQSADRWQALRLPERKRKEL